MEAKGERRDKVIFVAVTIVYFNYLVSNNVQLPTILTRVLFKKSYSYA